MNSTRIAIRYLTKPAAPAGHPALYLDEVHYCAVLEDQLDNLASVEADLAGPSHFPRTSVVYAIFERTGKRQPVKAAELRSVRRLGA